MDSTQKAAIAAIEKQQSEIKKDSPAWAVGEQLKDICAAEPASAALILRDLEVPEMSIAKSEEKIKAAADAKKHGNFSFVSYSEADAILRKFYGLPERVARGASKSDDTVDLADFL